MWYQSLSYIMFYLTNLVQENKKKTDSLKVIKRGHDNSIKNELYHVLDSILINACSFV